MMMDSQWSRRAVEVAQRAHGDEKVNMVIASCWCSDLIKLGEISNALTPCDPLRFDFFFHNNQLLLIILAIICLSASVPTFLTATWLN
mmetsp:Transcript_23108/g.38073  ORF Transcript_23108/g.38073 Transcript_23108/m.38073 type:complete len:88 (+) Transcript_23108:191-454(+)